MVISMNISNQYQFYVGTVRGVVASTQCKPGEPANFDLQNIGKSNEITSLNWGRSTNEILIGYKNDSTRLYDTLLGKYTHTINDIEGGDGGGIVGAEAISKNIIIGHRNGHVNIWRKKLIDSLKLNLDTGSTLQAVVSNNSRENIIGTGGEHNDFKLWDVEAKKCIFKAKSVHENCACVKCADIKIFLSEYALHCCQILLSLFQMGHDELNLPLPTTIRSICFFPHDEKLNACCTKEGYVLLYDERAQRRPVVKFVEPKASYTTLTIAYRQMQCIVGTTRGYMQLLDLKSPSKCVKTFKSFAGSVTDIICCPSTPIVASVSLDRHLRIHNIETKELLHKEYLKQSLTKFVMRPIVKEEVSEEVTDTVAAVEDDEDFEKLFESMETINDGKNKKRKMLKSDGKHRKKFLKEEETTAGIVKDDQDHEELFESMKTESDGKNKKRKSKSNGKLREKFAKEETTNTDDEDHENVLESMQIVNDDKSKKSKRKMLKLRANC